MEESNKESGSGLAITPGTNHQGSQLPGYFPYLSLAFKWVTTLIIILMACWIAYTIKMTTKPHKSQNIFVANMLITDIISATITHHCPAYHHDHRICHWCRGFHQLQISAVPGATCVCPLLHIPDNISGSGDSCCLALQAQEDHEAAYYYRVSVLLNSYVFFNAGYTKVA